MNLRAASVLIRHTWLSWMQYRSFFFLLAFMWMLPPLVALFVWSGAAGSGTIGGMSRPDFLFYYLALIPVNQLTYAQTNWTVGDAIRYGRMNHLLLRPLPPIWDALAAEAAGKVVFMTFIVPVTILLALLLRPPLHLAPRAAAAFLPALAAAWALRFLWGCWLALLSFWTSRADALLGLQDTLVFLLAGQAAPTTLLPAPLRQAAEILPFRYMLGFPVEVLSGKMTPAAEWRGFLLQAAWLLAAAGLSVLVWRRGIRRHTALGG